MRRKERPFASIIGPDRTGAVLEQVGSTNVSHGLSVKHDFDDSVASKCPSSLTAWQIKKYGSVCHQLLEGNTVELGRRIPLKQWKLCLNAPTVANIRRSNLLKYGTRTVRSEIEGKRSFLTSHDAACPVLSRNREHSAIPGAGR